MKSVVRRFVTRIAVTKNTVLVCPKDSSSARGAIVYLSTNMNLPIPGHIPPYQVGTKVDERFVTPEQVYATEETPTVKVDKFVQAQM